MGSVLAIGLMSGTSLDGIDAALVETDGQGHVRPIAFRSDPYSTQMRDQLRVASALALQYERPRASPPVMEAAGMVTRRHALSVRQLLADAGVAAADVAVVGFHGQTVAHRPDRGWTWQIGDGAALADMVGIAVVGDFRSADVAAGGQGAPLIPVYHAALCAQLARPVAVLNLGGVGNLTWIGADGTLVAFDTGPANALIDDWMLAEAGLPYDAGGAMAGQGRVDDSVLTGMLDTPWFDLPAPKSLDRADFSMQPARGLSAADGAATLTAFTAETVALALRLVPERPRRLFVAGGGRHNATLMRMIGARAAMPAEPIEAMGWDGDATEAEGFAYMAVRTLAGLPISFRGRRACRRRCRAGWCTGPVEMPCPARTDRAQCGAFDAIGDRGGQQEHDRDGGENRRIRPDPAPFQYPDQDVADILVQQIEAVGNRPQPDEGRPAEQRGAAQRDADDQQRDRQGDGQRGDPVAGRDRRPCGGDDPERAARPAAQPVGRDPDREPGDLRLDQQRAEQPGRFMAGEPRREGPDPGQRQPGQQHGVDMPEQPAPPQQRHDRVESEFDRQRPIGAVHRIDEDIDVQHRQVDEDATRRLQQIRPAGGENDEGGEQDRGPIGRIEPRCARQDEVGQRTAAIERDEDHEAADREEQADAVMAPGQRQGRRGAVPVHLLVAGGEVEQHHHQRGQTAQGIEFGQAGAGRGGRTGHDARR